jgi:hypothetical protein
MEKQVNVDPFSYSKVDILSTIVQVVTIVAGVVLAVTGNTTGLLALGALAGGARGTLVGDLYKKITENIDTSPRPPAPPALPSSTTTTSTTFAMLMVAIAILCISGCGIDRQFVIDSRKAILAEAGDYMTGCQSATVAPSFSIDWNDNITYAGGVFAGCESAGRLVQFKCIGLKDDQTGQTRMKCEPLSVWNRQAENK